MIAWLATIPPIVYGLTLALPYIYVAAGRWRWAMLPDAGLLALYFVRPSLALWVFCGSLIAVRWVPTLAGELAAMLRLGDYQGWTAQAIRFTLPALTTTPATGKTTILDMSSTAARSLPQQPVARTLPATSESDGQPIATPGNAVNDSLPGNVLPEAVREIIRFQAKVEAVVSFIGSGKVGQTEAIEIAFGCKRSGRPDSLYARARAAVQDRIGPDIPKYRALTEEQQGLRKELGL